VGLRKSPVVKLSREDKERLVWEIVKLKLFHGVWFDPQSSMVFVKRQMWCDREHLPWSEALNILKEPK